MNRPYGLGEQKMIADRAFHVKWDLKWNQAPGRVPDPESDEDDENSREIALTLAGLITRLAGMISDLAHGPRDSRALLRLYDDLYDLAVFVDEFGDIVRDMADPWEGDETDPAGEARDIAAAWDESQAHVLLPDMSQTEEETK